MKRQALALGLTLTLLVQAIWAPASFANDIGNDQSARSTAQSGSYSHTISNEGLELIKSFEGFSAYPMWDYSQYSYGYGSYVDPSTVYEDPSSPTGYSTTLYPDGIPEREATELLRTMVEDFNVYLNRFLEENKIALNQNQFDALSCFTYNLGKYIWSTQNYIFMQMLKSGEYLTNHERFIESYTSVCKAGGVELASLRKRRTREVTIFYSDISISDPNADLYVINASALNIRSEPTTASDILSSIKRGTVIRVHDYSDDGKWAYTSYCGFYGWVSMSYLISVDEAALVTQVNDSGVDGQGIHYIFDNVTMTATVGSSATTNASGYSGQYAGEVYLTKYILYKGSIYTLTALSDYAFKECDLLKSITIPASVTTIGAEAFYSCSKLSEVTLAEGLTSIGDRAFEDCDALKSISIPDSVTTLGTYVFANNAALQTVELGAGIPAIPNGMFYNCVALDEIVLPNSVSSIGTSAFTACVALTSIVIPAGVGSVGSAVFGSCNGLERVEIYDPDCVLANNSFSASSPVIYGYSDSTAQAYAEANGRMFIPFDTVTDDSIVVIGDNAMISLPAAPDVPTLIPNRRLSELVGKKVTVVTELGELILNEAMLESLAATGYDVSLRMTDVTFEEDSALGIKCVGVDLYVGGVLFAHDTADVEMVDVNVIGSIKYIVSGQVVTVTHDAACKVGYLVDGSYVAIDAVANEDGSYSFAVPEGVTEVLLVVIGDVDQNGKLDSGDIDALGVALQPDAEELSAEKKFAADVNENGKLNSADLILIGRSILDTSNTLYKAFEW